jgi:pyrroloquinoline quinone biosynthesis protein B
VIVRVLGSAAGGGFPQWNCNCRNCDGLRRGRIKAVPRTQSSVAVSADGASWVLFNASPDILAQLRAFPEAQPARAVRDTAIIAVVLVDSQIDHTTGLLMLREGGSLTVYCTDCVHDDLTTGNPLFSVLDHYCGVAWRPMSTDADALFRIDGLSGLAFRAVALASKPPPYSGHRLAPRDGDNVGMVVHDEAAGTTLFYAPGLGRMEPHLGLVLENANCLLLDGTFWTDDEMIRAGISDKRACDMGHPPHRPGRHARAPVAARAGAHPSTHNPILDEDSPERAQLSAAGIEVACDGMRLVV